MALALKIFILSTGTSSYSQVAKTNHCLPVKYTGKKRIKSYSLNDKIEIVLEMQTFSGRKNGVKQTVHDLCLILEVLQHLMEDKNSIPYHVMSQ